MTSLATQLKQLSLPGVNVGVELKKRKSFLFDSQKAASLDCDAFYGLGRNGFEGLCSDDSTLFADFISLFDESAKRTERSILLKHENEELDARIKNFLYRTSPYFLTRSSQKCLEWLIYRFRIEEFNANDLLMSLLPYFATKLYARLLQLFDISTLGKNWNFLILLQKEGSSPSKAIVVEQCMKNRGFFTAICDNVLKTIKAYRTSSFGVENHPCLSLYVMCTMELVFNIKDGHEEFLALLLPFVAKGLESAVLSHKASSYMIISGIAANLELGERVISYLLKLLTRNYNKRLESGFLTAVAVLCQMQGKTANLPKECIELICKSTNLLERLRQLSVTHDIENFLWLLIEELVTYAVNDHSLYDGVVQNALKDILQNFFLSQATLYKVASFVVTGSCDADKDIQNSLLEIILLLERKYPQILVETLNRIKTKGGHDEHLNVLSRMYLEFRTDKASSKESILPSIFEFSGSLPKQSTSALSEMTGYDPKMVRSELAKNFIRSRLSEIDRPQNVSSALQLVEDHFESFFHNLEEAFVVLLDLIYCERLAGSESANIALELLLSDHFVPSGNKLSWDVAFVACDFLLFTSGKRLPSSIVQSPFFQSRSWLSKLGKKEDAASFLSHLLEILKDDPEKIVQLRDASIRVSTALHRNCHQAATLRRPFYFVLNFAILKTTLSGCRISDLKTAETVFQEVILNLQNLIASFPAVTSKFDPCNKKCSSSTFSEHVTLLVESLQNSEREDRWASRCIDALSKILFECMSMLKIYNTEEGLTWEKSAKASDCNNKAEAVQLLLSVIKSKFCDFLLSTLPVTQGCKHLRETVRALVPLFFSSSGTFVCYLSQYWMSNMDLLTHGKVIAQALHLAFAALKENSFEVPRLLSADCVLVPGLLVAIAGKEEFIRKVAVNLLRFIHETHLKGLYTDLVKHLVKNADILVADPTSLPKVLSLFFCAKGGKSSIKQNRSSILDAVIVHNILPKYSPALVRLTLLQGLQSINSKTFFHRLMPMLKEILDMYHQQGRNATCEELHVASLVGVLLSRIEGNFLTDLDIKSVFYKALRCNVKLLLSSSADTTPQLMSLGHITRDFFGSINNDNIQIEMIQILLDISLQNSIVLEEVRKVFKRIRLRSAYICNEIDLFTSICKESMTVPAKKVKTDESGGVNPAQRLTHLLEFLQEKKKIVDQQELLPPLFRLLEATLDNSLGELGEYMKQLLLTMLLKILQKMRRLEQEDEELNAQISSMCKIEVVVHCVRSTENIQTQYHSLMLLSEIASFFPEKVLHNVMALFTFMGSHLLRKDDPYSFNIISMTMRNVIPALIKASFGAASNKNETIVQVIHTFVDALPHMPSHRKLLVLGELLSILGEASHLWILVLVLIGSCIGKPTADRHEGPSDLASVKVESDDVSHGAASFQAVVGICCSICNLYPLNEQMRSLLKCVEYLLELPLGDEEMVEWRKSCFRNVTLDVIDMKTLTAMQLRRFHLILLVVVLRVLETNRESISSNLGNLPKQYSPEHKKSDETNWKPNDITLLLQSFYERLFYLIHESNKHMGKFSKALVSRVYDVISQINVVLPFKCMIGVIDSLLDNQSLFIRRKALDLLAGRVASTLSFNEEELSAVARISEKMAGIAVTLVNNKCDSTESITLCYSCLVALKTTVRACGKARPDCFTEVLQCICDIVSHRVENIQVLSAAFLCFAEMCSCLRAYCIPYLNSFVPVVLLTICESRTLENETLLFSCLTAMHRLLENLPNFSSAYLDKAVEKIASLMLLTKYHDGSIDTSDDSNLPKRICLRLNVIVSILASKFSSHTLISAIGSCQRKAPSERMVFLTKPLCVLLLKHIEYLDKHAVAQCSLVLFPLLYELLDLRHSMSEALTTSEVDEAEESSCNVVVAALLKLPENSFRTCFFELFDWASHDDQCRLLTYYKLMLKLSKKMKALFSLFAGRIIESIACTFRTDLSVGSNYDELNRQELLKLMCDTLNSTLFNDTSGLVTKQRFELLLQPLIDQIEVVATCRIGDGIAQSLLRNHVIPCIAQLAASVIDESCRKLLNYKACIKSRSSSPKVRYYAMKTVEAIAEKLGEEYSVLLPESIPFLSELMEDDVEEVEVECHRVVKRIEESVRDPLQKYFSM